MHEGEELAVAAVEFVFPAAEIELVGGARGAQRVAEVEIEQAVAVDLNEFALRQQVFGGPVAVVAQMRLDDAAAVRGIGRRAPGQARIEQIAVWVGNHGNRRSLQPVHVDESMHRTKTPALGRREQRRVNPAIGERPFVAICEFALGAGDWAEFGSFQGEVDIAPVEGAPPDHADGAIVGIVLPIDFHDEIVEAAAGDDIDHPRHGVGAVYRGGAVLEHFDALDGDEGYGTQIDAGHLAPGARGGEAAPVEQYQGAAGVEIAQAESARAGAAGNDEAAEGIVHLHAGGQGAALEDIRNVVEAGEQRLLVVDYRERQRIGIGVAADARAGDDDLVDHRLADGAAENRRLRRGFLDVLVIAGIAGRRLRERRAANQCQAEAWQGHPLK